MNYDSFTLLISFNEIVEYSEFVLGIKEDNAFYTYIIDNLLNTVLSEYDINDTSYSDAMQYLANVTGFSMTHANDTCNAMLYIIIDIVTRHVAIDHIMYYREYDITHNVDGIKAYVTFTKKQTY